MVPIVGLVEEIFSDGFGTLEEGMQLLDKKKLEGLNNGENIGLCR